MGIGVQQLLELFSADGAAYQRKIFIAQMDVKLSDDGIHLLNLVVNHGGVSHVEGEMDLDAFYADIYEMADDIPTSSQPSALSVEAALEEAALAGDEVLGIFISGRMSGTFEGVARAARETAKRHPDFKYALIDSMTNCMELGWAVVAACEARDAGGSLEAEG